MIHKYLDLIKSNPSLFSNENSPFKIITDPREISKWKDEKIIELEKNEKPTSYANIGIIFEDQFIIVLRDLVEFPSGRRNGYFRLINSADIKGGQGIVVFPEIKGKILLQKQYRHATRSWHMEVPRGFGIPNTSAEENAYIEIREEIGGEIEELIDLGIFHNNTGAEGNVVRLFFARLKSVGNPNLDEGIEEYKLFSIDELEKQIRDGIITDGFTIGAYTRAKLLGVI